MRPGISRGGALDSHFGDCIGPDLVRSHRRSRDLEVPVPSVDRRSSAGDHRVLFPHSLISGPVPWAVVVETAHNTAFSAVVAELDLDGTEVDIGLEWTEIYAAASAVLVEPHPTAAV